MNGAENTAPAIIMLFLLFVLLIFITSYKVT